MSTGSIIVALIVPLLGIYIFYSLRKFKSGPAGKEHEKIKTLTTANFSNEIRSGITLVDFWADWCMPCKMMAPILNEVSAELDENTYVGKVNIEHHQAVANKYSVSSIPTLVLFKNGKEVNRFVGLKTKSFLLKQINSYK